MSLLTDTIVALATPVGTSAIAVVRVSGAQTRSLAEAVFGQVSSPRLAQHADYRDKAGDLVDDVLFTFFAAPHSFTGEDTLEISSHGNPFIAQKIIEDLLARGARPAEAGEFSKRAFLKGKMDLSQAEAVMDLIHARSERALAAANQQLRGSLGRQMEVLIGRLVKVVALVEAYIDFPEEDLPAEDQERMIDQVSELEKDTARLLATNHYGSMLRNGIRTVIIGEPNAGKSSLLNRLVGFERALVSPEPGTTRDYLEELISVGPHTLRLVDTAGLNPSAAELEKRGIGKTLQQAEEADLFLWVVDVTRSLPALPRGLLDKMLPAKTILVLNKIDLLEQVVSGVETYRTVEISATKGTGLDRLRDMIAVVADSFGSDVGDEIVAVNARHAHALARSSGSLDSARQKLISNSASELVASDLRSALEAYGEIAGRIDNEKILDELFANFCIGK